MALKKKGIFLSCSNVSPDIHFEKSKVSIISYLGQQIADLKKQLDEKDDQYLRAQAEIQNMNNHFKKERAQLI